MFTVAHIFGMQVNAIWNQCLISNEAQNIFKNWWLGFIGPMELLHRVRHPPEGIRGLRSYCRRVESK